MKESVTVLLAILGVSAVLAFAHTAPKAQTLGGEVKSNSASRDPATVRAFRKLHPCERGIDAGSKTRCRGYVVDHIKPLCFGGLDDPKNMAYQEYAESLLKDEFEREACALARKCTR